MVISIWKLVIDLVKMLKSDERMGLSFGLMLYIRPSLFRGLVCIVMYRIHISAMNRKGAYELC